MNQPTRKTYLNRLLALGFTLLCIDLGVFLRDRLLLGNDGPWWTRAAIVAVPWAVFGLCLLFYRRVIWRPDELEALVNHRAMAWAFCVMMAGVLIVGQLQAAHLMPLFEWTADRLFMTMAGLLLAGFLWNRIRFSW